MYIRMYKCAILQRVRILLGYVSILLRSEVRSENIHGSGSSRDPVMLS